MPILYCFAIYIGSILTPSLLKPLSFSVFSLKHGHGVPQGAQKGVVDEFGIHYRVLLGAGLAVSLLTSPTKASFLHRDISISNSMINQDTDGCSWTSFLIDLDLAIK